jgi:hypothetical protein
MSEIQSRLIVDLDSIDNGVSIVSRLDSRIIVENLDDFTVSTMEMVV